MLAWHDGQLVYLISRLKYTARALVLETYPRTERVVWAHELRPI